MTRKQIKPFHCSLRSCLAQFSCFLIGCFHPWVFRCARDSLDHSGWAHGDRARILFLVSDVMPLIYNKTFVDCRSLAYAMYLTIWNCKEHSYIFHFQCLGNQSSLVLQFVDSESNSKRSLLGYTVSVLYCYQTWPLSIGCARTVLLTRPGRTRTPTTRN